MYHTLASDVWTEDRDARKYSGPGPVVCHPPCRAWGRLRRFAKPRDDEKDLARHAIAMVRKYGGVLEHPAGSGLWSDQDLPHFPMTDRYGGWTMSVKQGAYGHRAAKHTWLYICGMVPYSVRPLDLAPGFVPVPVENMAVAEREATPRDFAIFLLEIAKSCGTTLP
ncbi:hypothetical protein [Tortoise microvirus 37]|nr:hypothetical protein [Tortoise microvirus 37]